jgi:ATP-dependent DNA helicase RecG
MDVTPPSTEPADALLAGFNQGTRTRLGKLGLHRRFDLVLHLPLRYEDETVVHAVMAAPQGVVCQVEGVVVECTVKFKPRRQLVARVRDHSGEVAVRLLNFYPSQQKQLSEGQRVRLCGELRSGFFGAEMIHPRIRVVGADTPMPDTESIQARRAPDLTGGTEKRTRLGRSTSVNG